MLETYNPFGGGINSKDDARDIAKNELVDCLNIMVDAVGRVRTSPSVTHAATGTDSSHTIDYDREGHNLFVWTADADWDDDSWSGSISADLSKREFIVMFDCATGEVDMWPQRDHDNFMNLIGYGDGSSGITVDLGVVSGGIADGFATFYAADNALRIMNGNFLKNVAMYTQWFGFIDKVYFPHTGTVSGDSLVNTANKWFQSHNDMTSPSKGVWSEHVQGTADTGGSSSQTLLMIPGDDLQGVVAAEFNATQYHVVDIGDPDHINLTENSSGGSNAGQIEFDDDNQNQQSWSGRAYSIHPPDGTGFCVDIDVTSSTDSMWKNGKYEVGQSFVYVGNQETNVVKLIGGQLTLAEDEYPKTTVTLTAGAIAPGTSGYHPRVIGGRIYTRRADVGAPWRLLVDVSFERGSRMSLNHGFDVYNYYYNTAASTQHINQIHYLYTDTYDIKAPNPDTFQSINGYDPEQPSHHMGSPGFGAKAAVVANQRAFLANVKHKDETGNATIHSDRILFSPIGKYDIFPSNHYIDIGLGDGDDIVNILETSDRLLVFKKKKLFVVNIGSGNDAGWFIEGEYPHKGINNKAAAFKSDLGCVWANNNGCYMFDGRQVADLTEKLDDDKWSDFISTGRVLVGYLPTKNQVIVAANSTGVGTSATNRTVITALVNGTPSSSTNIPVDTQSGTIEVGMTVTGTGISGTPTVASITSQNELVFSVAQSLSNNVELTFTQNHGIEVYIYDMRTRSWVRNNSLFPVDSNRKMTNFATHNNNLIYGLQTSASASRVNKVLTPSSSQEMEFVTKDEDFGQPSLKKKFYKIYVNYRNNESNDRYLECRYSKNGASAGATVELARSSGSKEYTLFSSTRATLESDNEWHIATFEASSPISGQSISLYFATVNGASSSVREASNIEINEVTIEWRPLRQRAST